MTDEEMAEKYKETVHRWRDSKGELVQEEDIVQAFLAGLKAGRPQWHDLRKNPNDLPKEVGNYIVCYLDTACERHTFELSFVDYLEDEHWIDENGHDIEVYDEGVIAWCEIPTFDKE